MGAISQRAHAREMKLMSTEIERPSIEVKIPIQTSPETEIDSNDQRDQGSDEIKIQVKNLTLFYGQFKALGDISLDFPKNRITAIIGPSGCGKSTLLRSLNRMNDLTPNVRIEGEVQRAK